MPSEGCLKSGKLGSSCTSLSFSARCRHVRVSNRISELAVGKVVPPTTNSIVEVIPLGQRRFQQFTAKKLVNQ